MKNTMGHSREVCLLIGQGGAILWSDASSSPVHLPDSRMRWEAIWARRVELVEIAHSHPLGPLGFSEEDESTMAALCSALGTHLRFSVVAPRGMVVRSGGEEHVVPRSEEPWWTALLRLASGMQATASEELAADSADTQAPNADSADTQDPDTHPVTTAARSRDVDEEP